MNRNLTICFTSDIHGYFSALDYATGAPASTGLVNCMTAFPDDGNTLILDGGDTLQGSPFTYWLYHTDRDEECVPARVMNLAGYDFVTLGNHDFNYGKAEIQRYLRQLDAQCLCANVEGIPEVEKTAVVTLENGLRVGLTGMTSPFVNIWEKPENLAGITVTDAFDAAKTALEELKAAQVDVTVCLYHGGFENDVRTGEALSQTGENQGWRICRELDFDVLLTAHQHQSLENLRLFGTYTCQPPDRARQFLRMEVSVSDTGAVTAQSRLIPAGNVADSEAAAYLEPLERENAAFLDTAVGHLDRELAPESELNMALHGSPIANFFNQVQLEASGADLSVTSLNSGIKGLCRDVTIRDIVATYVFPNTLQTIRVNRAVLKAALERSCAFFRLDEAGNIGISEDFLKPIPQFFNFDFLSGAEVTADIHRKVGDRVVSIRYQGQELPEDRELTLCLNNYRASGAGGYPLYAQCPLVREQPTEIAQLIMEYVTRHREITVDKTNWFRIV
ncbi:MAG: bifunctional UDP-sugar hydrolase/5'-nucleotidase [Firmicutes bacterium]|nr:bifunctional UDP-sugar hydrolase/5'-nucleotidase [Bacillota bacterium]